MLDGGSVEQVAPPVKMISVLIDLRDQIAGLGNAL